MPQIQSETFQWKINLSPRDLFQDNEGFIEKHLMKILIVIHI